VRRAHVGTGIGFAKTDHAGAGHGFQGRPSRHQTDGLALAKNTRSRRGSTSQCSGEPGQISPSKSVGCRRPRESNGTRRPKNGPTSRRRSQTPAGSNGRVTRTDRGHARCRYVDLSRTSSRRSRKRNGRRQGSGLEAEPPVKSTDRRARGLTVR